MKSLSGQAAREISYAFSAQSKSARALIRSIENITGRPRLLRMADGYESEVERGRDFWAVMRERYRIEFDFISGGLDNIPRDGPLVVVANHPYGILDGLTLGCILSTARGDFRIIANNVFQKAEDLRRIILPIEFAETKEAVRRNIATRKAALDYLSEGGTIGIFPGGTVSTAAKPFSRPMDPAWKTFTAKMIAKSGATVVPVYFEGQNSRLFQLASHIHTNLRLALLINEFDSRVGGPVRVSIGRPLDPQAVAHQTHDPRALMDFLRNATYALSPKPVKDFSYGLNLG